jgi:hypothetical protein
MFSNSFAGIAPSSAPGFISAHIVGGILAYGLDRGLYPGMAAVRSSRRHRAACAGWERPRDPLNRLVAGSPPISSSTEGNTIVHLIAVGGSGAGISAALRAREVDPGAEVTVGADASPNCSICGIPYSVSGKVSHRQAGVGTV